jgi:thioredoxin 1
MQWLIILLIALLLVLTGGKAFVLLRTRRQQESLAPSLHELMPEGEATGQRLLLYFYSEHCGSCRNVTPLIEELNRQGKGVVKVDVRRHLMTARRYGINATPSLVLVERGQIACTHVGAINDAMLQRFYSACRTS